MRRLFVFLTAIFTILTATAEEEYPIILDQSSVRKMTNLGLDNANIDPIRKDLSRNACARVKIRFANMSRAEVDALRIQFRSNTDLARQEVGYYDNILILEMTAKPATRFYVQSDTYGQSNEVSLNLEGNCVYEMEARLNLAFSIVVNSNVEGAEVYIDGNYKGCTDSANSCTIKGVIIGTHTLKLVYGDVTAEQQIDVNSGKISFRQDLNVEVERFDVTFKVQPATATIVVDNNGLELPINNGMFSLKLSKGTHTYQIKAADYRTAQGSFEVTATTAPLKISLTPAFGWLEVSGATLDGADVLINGKSVGTAPFKSGNLASGRYTVRVNKSLYKSFEGTVTISDNQTTEFNPTLTANFANVTLTVPANAEIWINGSQKGSGSWSGQLEVGNYTFEARKDGHRTTVLTRQIGLEPSTQSYTLSAPTPIYGSLIVNSSPVANVTVDGKVLGKSPVKLNNILIGQHTVVVSNNEFDSKTSSVTITEGKTTTLDIELSSIPKNQIHYTTTDGEALWLYKIVSASGAEIVSNTYKDGKGVITFNGEVTEIGVSAFCICDDLKSIIIPDGVTSIYNGAFSYCKNLESVTFGSSVKTIGDEVFQGCDKLKSITIPDGVTSIGSSAFKSCESLTNIVIPDSVTSIGERAFEYCKNLESVTIGSGVKYIGEKAFSSCYALKRVNISDISAWCQIYFEVIANPLFYAENLYLNGELVTELVIPQGVTKIKRDAFENCHSLTSVTIPNSVTSIGGWAFDDCDGLKSVTIPSSVTSIGYSAFSDCDNLISVYCYATTPPECGRAIFGYRPKKLKIYVPASAVKAYKKSSCWKKSGGKIVSM